MSVSRATGEDSREEEKAEGDWATPAEIRARVAEGTEHLTEQHTKK